MRYQPEHKVEIHRKIVKDASRRVRAEGITGAAVSAVMRDAGLTHGGFYKHFGSKDELLMESLSEAFRGDSRPPGSRWQSGPNRDGVEGDCEDLPEPGTLRSRRARMSFDGTCARVGAGRPGDEAPDL